MEAEDARREVRSFLIARDPSIDQRNRPRPEKKTRLFDEISEEAELSSSVISRGSSYFTDSDENKTENCEGALVYLRLKPVLNPSQAYKIANETLIICPPNELASTSNNKSTMERHFSFSSIFEGYVEQKSVYEECIRKKIENEENFTVLAYGTSGSGKTYTLLGDTENPGIVPRALENIFTMYKTSIESYPSLKIVKGSLEILSDDAANEELQLRQKLLKTCDTQHEEEFRKMQECVQEEHGFFCKESEGFFTTIWISFVEIYNELVYDLLAPTILAATQTTAINRQQSKNLKILGNDGKVIVKGLTSICVLDSMEALKIMRLGFQHANYAATNINSNSSRSHCIFFVDILNGHPSGIMKEISYKFADLAGSERLQKTGNTGFRLKEAQCINTSLMVLGRCLDAANSAGNKKKTNDIIPYRESKLTMILQSALLGKEKISMIVNVTPIDKYFEENMNVLSFASIAKNIIFKQPKCKSKYSRNSLFMNQTNASNINNNEVIHENYLQPLLQEIELLKNENSELKRQHRIELFTLEKNIRNQLVDEFQAANEAKKKRFEIRLQQKIDSLKQDYENKIEAMQRQHKAEIEDLKEEYEEYGKEKKRRTLD